MSVEIYQGDDKSFTIQVKFESGCYDLSAVTAASLKLPNHDHGQFTELTLGAGLLIPDPKNGKIQATLEDTDTIHLKAGKQSIELILDESGKFQTLQFKNGIEVKERLF